MDLHERERLEEAFEGRMYELYREAARVKYFAGYFHQMLQQRGGLATAQHCLGSGVEGPKVERDRVVRNRLVEEQEDRDRGHDPEEDHRRGPQHPRCCGPELGRGRQSGHRTLGRCSLIL